MSVLLLTLSAFALAVSEAVQLELIKLAGITVSALAGLASVWLTFRNRQEIRKLHRTRRAVRDEDHEQLQVIDEPVARPSRHERQVARRAGESADT